MAFRQLIEGDCGGANPLVQLGSHFTKDNAFRDDGFSQRSGQFKPGTQDEMVNEFLNKTAAPPQTFHMDHLLHEMRAIEAQNLQHSIMSGPKVINQVIAQPEMVSDWTKDFNTQEMPANIQPQLPPSIEITNNAYNPNIRPTGAVPKSLYRPMPVLNMGNQMYSMNRTGANYQPYLEHEKQLFDEKIDTSTEKVEDFFKTIEQKNEAMEQEQETWLPDFEKNKEEEIEKSENYYDKFWSKLQQDWNEMSEMDDAYPWLSQGADFEPYKEYDFYEENPMENVENVLEKGKEFLKQGDIPTAVLCFEAAIKQDQQNPEAWELLGLTQTENEMDAQAIAALKKALQFNPTNRTVLMALSIAYTNESLQSQALDMLVKWLHTNPKYANLVPPNLLLKENGTENIITTSLIGHAALKDIQNVFLEAVKQNSTTIDPEIQEALGVLFNLSSEYDKAVDCFQAALSVNPNSSKTWNRLGASLANGNRSVEAVEAYQRALEIQPGFIRARYNVGIICMNLKAYKEAAEHLLTALNMQASSIQRSGLKEKITSRLSPMSEVIWSTLRMVFALMGRDDLKKAANSKDLNCLNHEFKSD